MRSQLFQGDLVLNSYQVDEPEYQLKFDTTSHNNGEQLDQFQSFAFRPSSEFQKTSISSQQSQSICITKSNTPIRSQRNVESYSMTVWGRFPIKSTLYNQSRNTIQQFGSQIISAAAGENHTMILTIRQELFALGSNKYGQLGIKNTEYIEQPSLIIAIKDIKFKKVACGSDHTIALSESGEVYSWGLNVKGQLGIGNFENRNEPVIIYSLLSSEKALLFRAQEKQRNSKSQEILNFNLQMNTHNKLDRQNSVDDLTSRIAQLTEFRENPEQLSSQDTFSTPLLESDETVKHIACGALHSLVVSCFGETFALGHESTKSSSTFKLIGQLPRQKGSSDGFSINSITCISCGLSQSTCIMDGHAYIWGIAGTQHQSLVYTQPTQLRFPSDSPIIDCKSGSNYNIFLNANGEVFVLGDDAFTLSLGKAVISIPVKIDIPSARQIAIGCSSSFAMSADCRYVYGWGSNSQGQLSGCIPDQSQVYSQPRRIIQLSGENCSNVSINCGYFQVILLSKRPLSLNDFISRDSGIQDNATERLEAGNQLKMLRRKGQIESEHQNKILEDLERETSQLTMSNVNLLKSQERTQIELKAFEMKIYDLQLKLNQLHSNNETLQLNLNCTQEQTHAQALSLAHIQGLVQTQALVQTEVQAVQKVQLPNQQKFTIKGFERFKNVIHRSFNSCLEIDYSELIFEQKLSEGGYGIIHRARWRETVVAVKKFKNANEENTIKEFLSECHALEAVRHPNIVMFLGACTEAPNFSIILEFCQKGSLWSYLQSEIKINWDDRKRIALDIARGVYYLHTSTPPILHRDLKSLNVLLDDCNRCKLADFGWTKVLTEDNYMTAKIGTYQWMAPEVISTNFYSEKADVFSFGIILWEIASREPPFRNKTGAQVSIEVSQNKLRPTIPKACNQQFAELMQRCWEHEPEIRPTFKEIIKELEKINLTKPV